VSDREHRSALTAAELAKLPEPARRYFDHDHRLEAVGEVVGVPGYLVGSCERCPALRDDLMRRRGLVFDDAAPGSAGSTSGV
jgi:hypothetical protein